MKLGELVMKTEKLLDSIQKSLKAYHSVIVVVLTPVIVQIEQLLLKRKV